MLAWELLMHCTMIVVIQQPTPGLQRTFLRHLDQLSALGCRLGLRARVSQRRHQTHESTLNYSDWILEKEVLWSLGIRTPIWVLTACLEKSSSQSSFDKSPASNFSEAH